MYLASGRCEILLHCPESPLVKSIDLVFPLYYKHITFPCESCWMISPLPLFVTLISRSEYLVVNSFPPLSPPYLSLTQTHSHTVFLQVCISLPGTLPGLSEGFLSPFFPPVPFKFAVKWCPTHAAWLIIDFTQLMGGMIRSEYPGDLFNSEPKGREGGKSGPSDAAPSVENSYLRHAGWRGRLTCMRPVHARGASGQENK